MVKDILFKIVTLKFSAVVIFNGEKIIEVKLLFLSYIS